MSRLSSFLLAVVIIAGFVALASFLVSRAPEPERVESPPQIPYAQTCTVIAGSCAIPVYGAGTVRAGAEVDVAPQVGGRVVWVDAGFQSGGRVQAGETIFRIEEADYLYRVQEAEANLAARRVPCSRNRSRRPSPAPSMNDTRAGRGTGPGRPESVP